MPPACRGKYSVEERMPKLGKKELSMEQPALKVGLIVPMQIHTAAGELIELPRKVRGMFAYLVMRRVSSPQFQYH